MAFLCAMLLIVACGSKEPAEEGTPAPAPTAAAPTATPAPTPEPEPTSATTGLPSTKEYKPITIMIENSPAARPQTGLQQADIVYEAMAEGGITRMICVFNDQYPVVAGPVRSTRIYYLNIQQEWDSPMVHYGGPSNESKPSYVYGSNTKYIKVRVDGLKGKYNDYFWRDDARSAPNNVYTDVQKIKDELYDYTPNARDGFSFSADASYTGNTVTEVGVPFLSGKATHTRFLYDAETGLFTRYLGDKAFDVRTVTLDENGKKKTETAPMTVKNLIIQYANTYTIKGDNKGRRMVDVVGKGNCEYYINGVQVKGTWERESLTSSTHYYDDKGNPIVLQPGNTWICLQPTDDTTTVKY
ncbi:MAG: DUF3048 domain-containing protein [Christensenellaceae bacterium]|nr:DUF3048 domain-containing protein [Christensenellaceae bacterium]